ncbi:MAG: AsmA family protein [Burkholderiales bacterium]|nr:AsmA family protein [Burkholderiales bacterium]
MKGLRRFLAVAAALAALLVLALAALAALAPTLDASRWREGIAARASAALGRPVALEGALQVRLARVAEFRVGAMRVLNPPGFAAPEFASLRDARIEVDLLGLLRRRIVLPAVEASDVRVRLARAADGRANWTFGDADAAPRAPAVTRATIAVERVALNGLTVEYHDATSGTHRRIELDALTGAGGTNEPITVAARGTAAGGARYEAALTGGPARLLGADSRWPFAIDLGFGGTRVHAAGSVALDTPDAELEFGAGTDSVADVQALVGTQLPSFGAAAAAGRASVRPGAIDLADLRGVAGGAAFSGRLSLDASGARTRASGELAIAALDLRPFLRDPAADARRPFGYDDLAGNATALRTLVPVDLALALRVGRLAGVDLDVRDATLELVADAGGARAPMAVTVADVAFTGLARLDTAGAVPEVSLELGAQDARLAALALQATGLEGIEGSIERMALRANGRGETVGDVARGLAARLELERARLSYGSFAGGRPVGVALDTLVLEAPQGGRLRGAARGTLLGKPASFTLRGRELPRILRDGVLPLELDVAGAGAQARIEARAAPSGAALAFRADAARSGDLAEWLGFAPQSALPVALRGDARREAGGWHLRDVRLEVGRSVVVADVRLAAEGGRTVPRVRVASPLVDLAELATLRPPASSPQERRNLSLDVPVLPQRIDFPDADIDLALERVRSSRAEVTDVALTARIRDGYLPPAPLGLRVAAVRFEGTLGLDLRGHVPEAALELSASGADVGAVLRALGLADGVEAHADALEFRLAGRGATLGELAERSSLAARVTGGDLALHGPAGRPLGQIALRKGVVTAAPGEPVTARLDGAIDATDVELRVRTGTLADFAGEPRRVPLTVEGRAAGATLRIAGEAGLPLGRSGELAIELAGERLDSLSGLARVALPPWGPWSAAGPITMTATGYAIPRLALRVGSSELVGRGALELGGARPVLDLHVAAPRIQLDDFPRWRDAARAAPMTAESLRDQAAGAATQTQRVLDAAFLRRFDAYAEVEVGEVLVGADRLADGRLRVQLKDGDLYVGPAEVNVPGGTVKLSAAYDAEDSQIELRLGAHIERFDYSILARRRWPDSGVSGLFSMNLELASTARSLDAVLASANGRLDMAAWPKDLGARQVDNWAVNLFRLLLPALDPLLPGRGRGAESMVNCIVGRFDIVDGRLTEDLMIIDTSRIRVRGTGTVDFRTEAIDARFSPRTKRLQPLSLQPPLRVSGTLTDFRIGLAPEDLLAALARFLTSVVVVPLERLFRGPIPVDGSDVCADPLRLVEPERR